MTALETRTAARAAVILLFVSLARLTLESRHTLPLVPDGSVDLSQQLLEAGHARAEELERRTLPLAPGERLDVNSAPAEELDRLPRVGPAVAEAIVQERMRGRFVSFDDLTRVRGIGPATLERLRAHVTVGPGSKMAGAGLTRPLVRPAERLSLARASAEDFEALPGIGPALAARIVQARVDRGGFSSVEDLLEVQGIGSARLDALRDRVRVP
jgi:competence ComEA-like helix-hairpin-helix protein